MNNRNGIKAESRMQRIMESIQISKESYRDWRIKQRTLALDVMHVILSKYLISKVTHIDLDVQIQGVRKLPMSVK